MKRLAFGVAAVAAVAALGACTKKSESQSDAAAPETPETASIEEAAKAVENLATVDADAPEASGEERFYGKKEFTIVSRQTGVETGEIIEHARDWGRRRVEIKRTTLSVAGQSIATNTRVVSDGAQFATIDLDSGAVTTAMNPMYDTMVARMKRRSGVEVGKEMMAAMGGRETGEKGSFAGHGCDYWELQGLGAKTCITPWGGTLHMSVSIGGMAFERTASEVRLGDGGPEEAFAYDKSKATEAPDIGELLKKAREGNPQ